MQKLRLECFGVKEAQTDQVMTTLTALEEQRLAAYDTGYRAGWDDAGAARDAQRSAEVEAALQHLQDLSFTYHEARQALLAEIAPLMAEIVGKVLPAAAHRSLVPMIVDLLRDKAADLANLPLRVTAPAAVLSQLRSQLGAVGDGGLPVDYVEAGPGAAGVAVVAFSRGETKIDLDALTARIGAAVSDYFTSNRQDDDDERSAKPAAPRG